MSRKRVILAVLIFFIAGGLGISGFYAYNRAHYVSTDNARVAAQVARVRPQIMGKILSWQISEGDYVKAGQILGRQDLGASMSSAALNPGGLSDMGGVIADKALLKAPIDGMVIQSDVVIGQMALPGTSVATVADTDHLYISAEIKEVNISQIRQGQQVDVHIDAYPHRTFRGRVELIGRATASTFSLLPAQNDSGNYTKVTQVVPIRVHLTDTDGTELMVGMSSSIRIHISE